MGRRRQSSSGFGRLGPSEPRCCSHPIAVFFDDNRLPVMHQPVDQGPKGKARGECLTILLGRYQNANKTGASSLKLVPANKTENKTVLDRRTRRDDQIEIHRGGALQKIKTGSEFPIGNTHTDQTKQIVRPPRILVGRYAELAIQGPQQFVSVRQELKQSPFDRHCHRWDVAGSVEAIIHLSRELTCVCPFILRATLRQAHCVVKPCANCFRPHAR